jgi:hypothetical protein
MLSYDLQGAGPHVHRGSPVTIFQANLAQLIQRVYPRQLVTDSNALSYSVVQYGHRPVAIMLSQNYTKSNEDVDLAKVIPKVPVQHSSRFKVVRGSTISADALFCSCEITVCMRHTQRLIDHLVQFQGFPEQLNRFVIFFREIFRHSLVMKHVGLAEGIINPPIDIQCLAKPLPPFLPPVKLVENDTVSIERVPLTQQSGLAPDSPVHRYRPLQIGYGEIQLRGEPVQQAALTQCVPRRQWYSKPLRGSNRARL